jgi:hypothetical protein
MSSNKQPAGRRRTKFEDKVITMTGKQNKQNASFPTDVQQLQKQLDTSFAQFSKKPDEQTAKELAAMRYCFSRCFNFIT